MIFVTDKVEMLMTILMLFFQIAGDFIMANGTIAFDTLQTSGQIDGTARSIDTDYLLNGSAKSWVNFEGDNTAIRDSFNISSLDDDGTGDYGAHLPIVLQMMTFQLLVQF